MRNVLVVVKPDETINDIIAQICQIEDIGSDDLFAFSCIMTKDVEGCSKLKINCLEPPDTNPYTPVELILKLFEQEERKIKYVIPPLEQYLETFKPNLRKMVNKVYPYYSTLIPDKEDLMSILTLKVVTLHNKGYYLHNHLIYKSFINELNKIIRKQKYFSDMKSLDEPIGTDTDGKSYSLLDKLENAEATQEAYQNTNYTEYDYDSDIFKSIKEAMIEDMGQFAFNILMVRLKTKTIDPATSRILTKYREEFNPGYIPRPNARGKSKGGKNGPKYI